ncbi:MAG: hypothetical protein OXD31_16830 [Chloroflexi bacterium]|nr:hypothetical protein [Chloroflexota bacterium]
MDSTFDWILILLVLAATMIAIKGTVRFDVNEWLKQRREVKEERLRRLCPHVLMKDEGRLVLESAYFSPFGTTAWQCQVCGHTLYNREMAENDLQYWATHPDQLLKRLHEAKKLAKKLGYV